VQCAGGPIALTTITITIAVDDNARLPDVWAWIDGQLDENYAPDGVQLVDTREE